MIPEGVVLVAGPYSATGVTNTYDFEFPCSSDENVEVTVSVDGVESVLVLDTDFTVSLNPDQDSTPGGTVIITPVPASGTLVVIASNVPVQQGLDLTQGGSFNPETIEQKLDDIVLMIGRLRADIDRAVKSGITSSTDPDVLIAALLAAEASAAASAVAAELAAAAAEAAVPSGSLGYTPVDKAGDSMTGTLIVPALTIGSQTITGITALGKTLVQIASQAAARSAVDAAQKTSSQTAAAPVAGDYISFSDVSDSGNEKKATLADLLAIGGMDGAFRSIQVFTSSGTYTAPAGLKRAKVTVVGGGGGGGGAYAGSGSGGGGGGGGGAVVEVLAAATIGASQSITVGAGGAAGAYPTWVGASGGTSSFGSLLSATGGGGGYNDGGGVPPYGGTGGMGAGGDLNMGGTPGASAGATGGSGGGSVLGGGGYAGNNGAGTYAGGAGRAYGGGGGGAYYNGQQNGGAGAAGVVIVEEFF